MKDDGDYSSRWALYEVFTSVKLHKAKTKKAFLGSFVLVPTARPTPTHAHTCTPTHAHPHMHTHTVSVRRNADAVHSDWKQRSLSPVLTLLLLFVSMMCLNSDAD